MRQLANRVDAGRELASRLDTYRGRGDVVVLGLPRGGVPVAYEIARVLDLPLDVVIVRKLGAPGQPEFALGAIASPGIVVLNEGIPAAVLDSTAFARELRDEVQELTRREAMYRSDRPTWPVRNRTILLVDDGAATGASMLAAVRALRSLGAQRIVVALPVASESAHQKLAEEADQVVCLMTPRDLSAVGEWYLDFSQTTDQEVVSLLSQSDAAAGDRLAK